MKAPTVSILIATRNRPEELRITLASLQQQTWRDVEIIVLDDGSTTHDPTILACEFPAIRFMGWLQSRGYIEARNCLMDEASGKYFVHLDDDASWIRRDALERAVTWLDSDPKIGAFAFQVHEAPEAPCAGPPATSNGTLEAVRSFTGCGHIIRRLAFESLGPLRTEFEFYCEEIDFCLKLWKAGWRVVCDRGLVVHHRVDWNLRDRIRGGDADELKGHMGKDRRVRLGTRNELWWITERAPLILLPILISNKLAKLSLFHLRRGFLADVWRGAGDWLLLAPRLARTRDPLSFKAFVHWLRLPT